MGLACLKAVKDGETVFVAMAMSFHEVLVTESGNTAVHTRGARIRCSGHPLPHSHLRPTWARYLKPSPVLKACLVALKVRRFSRGSEPLTFRVVLWRS